ncbi:unnamed protein product [Medioppia subpectinata]|uniref:C2H2-type domain-containing protein n=1 Tax=Medioppia subpectinata TaxID=1979941 RepID=A0A7R9KEK2_9ACAR|nr:unnamed protein product [Medioppia subpectinata]CAG2101150.1 unnamed protein product [Medioppia subpectinata]
MGERPYKCSVPECGRAFIQLSNLQQHMRSHCSLDKVAKNNEKKYVCNHCGKGFKGQSSLATHQSKKHSNLVAEGVGSCPVCHLILPSNEEISLHIKKEHNGFIESQRFSRENRMISPYTCPICAKSYLNEGSYRRHLESHPEALSSPTSSSSSSSSIPLWPCSVCTSVFTSEIGLLTHMEQMRTDAKHQFEAQIILSCAAAEKRHRDAIASLNNSFVTNASQNNNSSTTLSTSMGSNLGKNGLRVPNVGFSAWNGFGNRINEQMAEELLTLAYENGINYFDTGDGYANGKCELLLGNILKKKNWKRSSYIVSTKLFWYNGPTAHNSGGLSRKFIIEAVEASLKRLQLKYIDILIINKLDGTSRFAPMHISEAFSISRQFNCPAPVCEQMEYHMFSRDKMELFMPELFHKIGTGCIVWSPMSLNYDEGIQLITRKTVSYDEKVAQNAKHLELSIIADKLGCDQTQLTIAWSLRNEHVNSVLIAPTTVDQLYQQLHALKIVPKLTANLIDEIEKILENKPSFRRLQHNTSVPGIQCEDVPQTDDTNNESNI